MNLYLLHDYTAKGYDRYYKAVVAAETEEAARLIHPSRRELSFEQDKEHWLTTWRDPRLLGVTRLGTAAEGLRTGVICADFHAG